MSKGIQRYIWSTGFKSQIRGKQRGTQAFMGYIWLMIEPPYCECAWYPRGAIDFTKEDGLIYNPN